MAATIVREFADSHHDGPAEAGHYLCQHHQDSEARRRTLCFECFRLRQDTVESQDGQVSGVAPAPLRPGQLTDREIRHRHALLANLERHRARAD
jgi:hypothetical protein